VQPCSQDNEYYTLQTMSKYVQFLKALIIQSLAGNEFSRHKSFYSILLLDIIFMKEPNYVANGCYKWIVNEPHQIALIV